MAGLLSILIVCVVIASVDCFRIGSQPRPYRRYNRRHPSQRQRGSITRFASWNVLASEATGWLIKDKQNYPRNSKRGKETDEERDARYDKVDSIITKHRGEFDAIMLQELDGYLVEKLSQGLLQICQSCLLLWHPAMVMSPANDENCTSPFFMRASEGAAERVPTSPSDSCGAVIDWQAEDVRFKKEQRGVYKEASLLGAFGTGIILTRKEYFLCKHAVAISTPRASGKGWLAVRVRNTSNSVQWVVAMHTNGFFGRDGKVFTDSSLYEELTSMLDGARAIVGADTNSPPLTDKLINKHVFGNNYAPHELVWRDNDYNKDYTALYRNIRGTTAKALAAFCRNKTDERRAIAESALVGWLSQYFAGGNANRDIYVSYLIGVCTAETWKQDLALTQLAAQKFKIWKPGRTASGQTGWRMPASLDRFLFSDSLSRYFADHQPSRKPKVGVLQQIGWTSPWLNIKDINMWPSDHILINISLS